MTHKNKFLLKTATWAARILPSSVKRGLYKIPFLARFIRSSLNTAVPDGFTEITIAAGILEGLHMVLDLHTEKDYWLGTYETDLQGAARHYIKPGMIVYDVGANIGYISLMAARLVEKEGKVFSFEALPANILRLKQHIALNGIQNYTQVIHAAVVDKTEDVTFLTHASGAMGKAAGSTGREEIYNKKIEVPGIMLDHFVYTLGNPAPALIKVDIEGGEGLALAGMPRLLKEVRPILLIELHGEKAARRVWGCLKSNDYMVRSMQKDSHIIGSLSELDWKAYIVALPNKNSKLN